MIGMSRIRRANSGAAPISPDLLRWYWGIGIPVYEGYGQTEGSGLTSVNTPQRMRNGTVGPAIEGLNVRIAPDGEIQMKGPNVFSGYWEKPELTAGALTADGWLRTGDVGRIDADGFIIITGRLKDIIITAGGKNITPSEIENRLKFSPYISDAVVIGDRKPYLTCLIMIDQENVEKFAQDHRIPFNDFASLCAAPAVKDLIHSVVEEANSHFARVEQVKDFRIIDVLLTVEDDELTATMKLKRSFVEKKYKALIDGMYAGNAA
jgi:long-chain acyl-CoA synthetase